MTNGIIEGEAQPWQDVVLYFGFEAQWQVLLKKLRLNPSDEAPPLGFKHSLEKWIQNGNAEDVVVEVILLNSHYKYDRVNMSSLLDVMDKDLLASFL